jgi:hypothetical protein
MMMGNTPGNKGVPWSEDRRGKQNEAYKKRTQTNIQGE